MHIEFIVLVLGITTGVAIVKGMYHLPIIIAISVVFAALTTSLYVSNYNNFGVQFTRQTLWQYLTPVFLERFLTILPAIFTYSVFVKMSEGLRTSSTLRCQEKFLKKRRG